MRNESERADDRFDFFIDDIRYDRKFVFEHIGYNFLPIEVMAAFGLVQLEQLSKFAEARRANFESLLGFFSEYEQWFVPPRHHEAANPLWLAYPLLVRDDAPFTRTDLQIHFEQKGIQTRVIFTGNILRQPAFKSIEHVADRAGYPNADYVMRGGLLLGCHQGMDESQISYVQDQFRAFAESMV